MPPVGLALENPSHVRKIEREARSSKPGAVTNYIYYELLVKFANHSGFGAHEKPTTIISGPRVPSRQQRPEATLREWEGRFHLWASV